jgi:DNA-binding NtrC family response regulator
MNWTPGLTLENVEKLVIEQALVFYEHNKQRTADALGIAIRTLDNKLAKYEGKPEKVNAKPAAAAH